ncbi:MAG: two-component regulator propeller domain-containing protein [Bacteroidota bacterium]|nr:two-component regulator propeller domain-containing protein [Bacteroidota bacterium]
MNYIIRNSILWLTITISSAAQQFDFLRYTVKDGLSSDYIHSIIQDSQRRLWIATGDGITIYDGEKFSTLRSNSGLINDYVNCFLEDTATCGGMWIGTNGGVDLYRGGLFRHFIFSKFDWSNRVNVLFRRSSGEIWCGTEEGIFVIDNHHSVQRVDTNTVLHNVSSILESDSSLYCCSANGVFVRKKNTSEFVLLISKKHNIVDLVKGTNGSIWGYASNGLVIQIKNFLITARRKLPCSDIVKLESKDSSHFVVTTNNELIEFHSLQSPYGFLRKLVSKKFLQSYSVTASCIGAEGELWIGTFQHGVVKISELHRQFFASKYFAAECNNSNIICNQNGECYITTIKNTVVIKNKSSTGFTAAVLPMKAKFFFKNSNGDIWLLKWNGSIASFEQGISKRYFSLTSLLNISLDKILCLAIDKKQRLWVSLETQGVVALDIHSQKEIKRFTMQTRLPDNSIRSLYVDSFGNVWCGGYTNGISRITEVKKDSFVLKHFDVNEGIPEGGVRASLEVFPGHLFIGTRYHGIVEIHGDTVTPSPINSRLESSGIWSLCTSSHGTVLIGTQSGIQEYDPSTSRMKTLIRTMPVYSCCVNEDDVMFAYSTLGVTIIDHVSERKSLIPPNIIVSSILVEGRPTQIPLSKPFRYDQNTFTFSFHSFTMRDNNELTYHYQLEGIETTWHEQTRAIPITYAQLDPGQYVFHVYAENSDGIRSENIASVPFVIVPPFWKEWWFMSFVVIAVVSLVASLIAFRVHHLLEIERVRSRIAVDLHDDIGSGLTQIALLTDIARKKLKQKGKRSNAEFSFDLVLNEAGKTSRELVDSMSDVVWSIDPKEKTIQDVTSRLRSFALELCESKHITFTISIADELRKIALSPTLLRTILMICKEALHNAIKYSECSLLTVSILPKEKRICIDVIDNGAGFIVAQSKDGNGLKNMKLRAEKIGGSFSIVSSPQGTAISVKVPLSV